jgi:methionyl-tRNA formyltransferase
MNLDKQTGISIMKIAEKLDAGPICNSYPLNILENENVESLSERLSLLAAEKILDDIDAILEDRAVFKPQENAKATYASKILKSEGRINWSETVKKIIGKINGLYPNSFFVYKGERYKVLKGEPSDKIGEMGNVLSDNLDIGCKDGSIKILEIQREGKRPQKINEFILGSKIIKGSILKDA